MASERSATSNQPPIYGLMLALLPTCAAFGEFFRSWHPLTIIAFLYLLGALVYFAYEELRARSSAGSVGLGPYLLLLAVFMLAAFGLQDALFMLAAGRWQPLKLPVDADMLYYGTSIVLLVAVFAIARRIPGARFEFNLRWRWSWWDAAVFAGIGAATFLILSQYLKVLGGEHPQMHIFGIDPASISPALYLAIGALFTLINAATEELWYRGILLAALRPLLPPVAAILLQGLTFGIIHWFGTPQGIFGLVLAGLWGIALGWWAYARRSLWQALLMHFLADGLIYWYTNG